MADQIERRCSCKYLRSKEMFHSDKPYVEDMYHSGIYWCHLTQDGRGPDGKFVDSLDCAAGRECFEDY